MEGGFRLVFFKVDILGIEHGLQFFEGHHEVHVASDASSHCLQFLGRAWPDEYHPRVRVFLFDGPGSGYHRRQLLGYLVDQIRELLFRQHCPGWAAGRKQERKFSGTNLIHIMMSLGYRSDVRPQRHLIHFAESQFVKGGL